MDRSTYIKPESLCVQGGSQWDITGMGNLKINRLCSAVGEIGEQNIDKNTDLELLQGKLEEALGRQKKQHLRLT